MSKKEKYYKPGTKKNVFTKEDLKEGFGNLKNFSLYEGLKADNHAYKYCQELFG